MTRYEPGGGVYFGAIAASNLGMEVASVISKCAKKDVALFAPRFLESGISESSLHLIAEGCNASTSCQNEYPTDRPDDRYD